MNRNQRRQVERELSKLSPAARNACEDTGVQKAMYLVSEALHAEFGFGPKRLSRLEKAMHNILLEGDTNEKK